MPTNRRAQSLAYAAAEPPELVADDGGADYRAAFYSEQEESEAVRRYTPVVKRIAMHLKGRLSETVQLDDLVQAGLIAVLRAVRRGIVAPNAASNSLHRTIRNAMIDEARREIWAPVRTLRLAKAAGIAMRTVKARLGRDGSDEEVAAEMGVGLGEYHALLVEIAGIRLFQLDECASGEERLRAADDQHAALDKTRLLAALTLAIAALPQRERLVVSLYYEHELNMDEVGKVLEIDKSTVCRAHGRALLILRAALDDWRSDDGAGERAVGG